MLDAAFPLLLDSAAGTELQRRGADVSPPLWSARALLESPALVREVHRENAAAGADVLTAATFRTHRRNLEPAGLAGRAGELAAAAVGLAREGARLAGRDGVLVAGSHAPLEDCYRPDLVPDDAALQKEHAEHARHLADAGVDLILVETMCTVRELVAATRAALATGLPVVASAVTDGTGRLLSGEPLPTAAAALLSLPRPPDALGVNCVPARRLLSELEKLSAAAPGHPLAAYGNTGLPLDDCGEAFTDPIDPEEYAARAREWLSRGVHLVGGCCGTRPVHIAALRKLLDALRP